LSSKFRSWMISIESCMIDMSFLDSCL
jgi:hypothetical protein